MRHFDTMFIVVVNFQVVVVESKLCLMKIDDGS